MDELEGIYQSQFVAITSHKLRTPLNIILGFAEVLKDQMLGPLTSEQEDALSEIVQNAHKLTVVVNDLLDRWQVITGFRFKKRGDL